MALNFQGDRDSYTHPNAETAIAYARGAGFTVDDYVPGKPVVAGREDMKSVFTLNRIADNKYIWNRPYGANT